MPVVTFAKTVTKHHVEDTDGGDAVLTKVWPSSHNYSYKILLGMRREHEVRFLLSACTFGAPPILTAARNGHADIVEYLISKNADIEQRGVTEIDGEKIEGATALWCAAAAGHFDVVKLLVKNGADVNRPSGTNSTPLRAACFDGYLEIVRFLVEHGADVEIANRHGHTSLMIACYRGHVKVAEYLISVGANVNQKSLKGNTALHDGAECGNVEIVKLLLANNAVMEEDAYGLTPLIAAASLGNEEVVNYLITLPECSARQRRDGFLLLGATMIDRKTDLAGALQYWRRAFKTDVKELADDDHHLVLNKEAANAYNCLQEISSTQELEEIADNPDQLRMQSLVMRERILGIGHPDTTYYIRYRGAVYADLGNFKRCIELWLYAVEKQQMFMEPMCALTVSSFLSFAELFSCMLNESAAICHVGPDCVFTVLRMATEEMARSFSPDSQCRHTGGSVISVLHRLCVITLHIIGLFCRLDCHLSDDERSRLKKQIYKLVKADPRGFMQTPLLHMACNAETSVLGRYPVCTFPSISVIKLLLAVGADVNSTDVYGNTALHIILSKVKTVRRSIVIRLLDAGIHVDFTNTFGVTAIDHILTMNLAIPLLKYRTLKCFAAAVIRKHRINYQSIVPLGLVEFVKRH